VHVNTVRTVSAEQKAMHEDVKLTGWETLKICLSSIAGALIALATNATQAQEWSLLARSRYVLEGVLPAAGVEGSILTIFSIAAYFSAAALAAYFFHVKTVKDAFVVGFATLAVMNLVVPTSALPLGMGGAA
jgi:hypothetical protein